MKKIIDDIKDFHKIKVGYTVCFIKNENSKMHLNEIAHIDYISKIITLTRRKNCPIVDEIKDIFESDIGTDIIFPCSLEKSILFFPEYYI